MVGGRMRAGSESILVLCVYIYGVVVGGGRMRAVVEGEEL